MVESDSPGSIEIELEAWCEGCLVQILFGEVSQSSQGTDEDVQKDIHTELDSPNMEHC